MASSPEMPLNRVIGMRPKENDEDTQAALDYMRLKTLCLGTVTLKRQRRRSWGTWTLHCSGNNGWYHKNGNNIRQQFLGPSFHGQRYNALFFNKNQK